MHPTLLLPEGTGDNATHGGAARGNGGFCTLQWCIQGEGRFCTPQWKQRKTGDCASHSGAGRGGGGGLKPRVVQPEGRWDSPHITEEILWFCIIVKPGDKGIPPSVEAKQRQGVNSVSVENRCEMGVVTW